MLTKKELLNNLKTFNINSQEYEPTIYEKDNELGLCLDFKDSLFGYLTRLFIFNTKDELNDFLTSYFTYKENLIKYNLTLSLDKYNTKKPKIIYKFKNKEINLKNISDIDKLIEDEKIKQDQNSKKDYYLKCISELTSYLINFKQLKENNKIEKNKLKSLENDLKYILLEQLIIYYGRNKTLDKKPINLEPTDIIDNTLLLNNQENIKSKSLEDVINYLRSLIDITKEEELDEKNLVNIYSNSIYKYNINILNKQIEFVKNKINSEKNFNIKGSKIHNIDEELRSFLKTNISPIKLEVFLSDNKNKIMEKFNSIKNLDDACFIITGNKVSMEKSKEEKQINIYDYLNSEFNSLPKKIKSSLILYNSIFKPICNYIINNNYPSVDNIINAFDFNYYYNELQEIVFNENNSHYLVNYFNNINFKDLKSYISSIIDLCKDFEQTKFNIIEPIQLFSINTNNLYKQLSPIFNKNSKYLITTNNPLIYIPLKLNIDFETNEITISNEINFYTKENIVEELETIILYEYSKNNVKENGIIITKDLVLNNECTFNKAHLEGDIYE